ncbi:MAG: cysteine desulfurase family protein [Peptoniphilaceae bacterium]|nr:cysteine desulfurase family protein [Peptoniphilaceae bacterium]MDY6019589.1 cysteine desulfurase family protein [Anaerococcus sp.]
MIYLDNAATTRMYDEVIDAEKNVEKNFFANPSALHSFGMEAENLIKESKRTFAKELGCEENEIYFTKGATESNNIIISSLASKQAEAISTGIEHASVYDAFNNYEYKEVKYLKNDKYGYIDLKDLEKSLTEDTKLVSIIYVNNETGTIQNIKEISKIVKEYNKDILLHIDATQALAKEDCKVKSLGVDALSFSGHKIHGPKGVGGLYVSKNFISKLKPLLYGGRQEIISSGTYNSPAIVAMAKALELMKEKNERSYIKELNLYFRKLVKENISNYTFISPSDKVSYYILNVGFANIKSEVLLHMLEEEEIYVSSGSACSKGAKSRVLENLNVDNKFIDGSLRFSFSSDITKKDIDKTINILKNSIEIIRKVM